MILILVDTKGPTCSEGDVDGPVYKDSIKTCSEYMETESDSHRCYEDYFRQQCCYSCQQKTGENSFMGNFQPKHKGDLYLISNRPNYSHCVNAVMKNSSL